MATQSELRQAVSTVINALGEQAGVTAVEAEAAARSIVQLADARTKYGEFFRHLAAAHAALGEVRSALATTKDDYTNGVQGAQAGVVAKNDHVNTVYRQTIQREEGIATLESAGISLALLRSGVQDETSWVRKGDENFDTLNTRVGAISESLGTLMLDAGLVETEAFAAQTGVIGAIPAQLTDQQKLNAQAVVSLESYRNATV